MKVLNFIFAEATFVLLLSTIVGLMYLLKPIEDEIRCNNGATEYCIGESNAKENN